MTPDNNCPPLLKVTIIVSGQAKAMKKYPQIQICILFTETIYDLTSCYPEFFSEQIKRGNILLFKFPLNLLNYPQGTCAHNAKYLLITIKICCVY